MVETKSIQEKADKLRESIKEFSKKAQDDLNDKNQEVVAKQNELQSLTRAYQKRIDQMEGAHAAYTELLKETEPKQADPKVDPTPPK